MKILLRNCLVGLLISSTVIAGQPKVNSPQGSPNDSPKQTVHILDIDLRRVDKGLTFDNATNLFSKVFLNGEPIRKDKFETKAEFKARLHRLGAGALGKEFTFLVPTNLLNIIAVPENSFYVIASADLNLGEENPTVTIYSANTPALQYKAQNAFGAKTVVTAFRQTVYKLRITSFPKGLYWKENKDTFPQIGMPIVIKSDEYRNLLRHNGLTLAIKVVPENLDLAEHRISGTSATINDPNELFVDTYEVPARLVGAWVYRVDPGKAILEWLKP